MWNVKFSEILQDAFSQNELRRLVQIHLHEDPDNIFSMPSTKKTMISDLLAWIHRHDNFIQFIDICQKQNPTNEPLQQFAKEMKSYTDAQPVPPLHFKIVPVTESYSWWIAFIIGVSVFVLSTVDIPKQEPNGETVEALIEQLKINGWHNEIATDIEEMRITVEKAETVLANATATSTIIVPTAQATFATEAMSTVEAPLMIDGTTVSKTIATLTVQAATQEMTHTVAIPTAQATIQETTHEIATTIAQTATQEAIQATQVAAQATSDYLQSIACSPYTFHHIESSNETSIEFDLPAAAHGEIIDLPDGSNIQYISSTWHIIGWENISFSCDRGNWELSNEPHIYSNSLCTE